MKKILIVEDESIVAWDLKGKLEKFGYEVPEILSYGEEVEKTVENLMPDLVMMDIQLEGKMDGVEAAEIVHSKFDLPVVFLTAFADDKTITRAKLTNPFGYVLKPFDEKEIKTNIEIALYKHATERELKELNALKDKFFSIIANNLNSPFSGFLSHAEMLVKEFEDLSITDMEELSTKMYSSAANLHKMLENLLEWSKVRKADYSFKPVKLNLKYLVEDNLSLFKIRAKEKNISIVNKVPGHINIFSDLGMTNKIIRNLLSNAIKYSYKNGLIELDATGSDSIATLLVMDYGKGIEDNIKERIFCIEHHFSLPGTGHEKGTGLGLLLSKELAEINKGSIGFNSEPGKGAEFYLQLPMAE